MKLNKLKDIFSKSWVLDLVAIGIGAATAYGARLLYKKLKSGKFKRLLSEQEKQRIMKEIENFLPDVKEE